MKEQMYIVLCECHGGQYEYFVYDYDESFDPRELIDCSTVFLKVM
jgi:hypothetical protein